MHKKSRGFTLVELLVVLAIVGILAALISVAASRVREKARVLSCQSNLALIGRAIMQYAAANRDFMPGGQPSNDKINSTALVTSLLPYRHIIPYIVPDADPDSYANAPPPQVFRCPSDNTVFGEKWEDDYGYTTSYLYNTVEMTNGTVIDASTTNGIRYTNSNHAMPRLKSYFDYNTNWKDGINEPSRQEMMIDSTPYIDGQDGTSYRHFKNRGEQGEGSNVLFFDGHVEFVESNPSDIVFETGFDFLKDADPSSEDMKDRYWIRWIARKY